MSTSTHWERWVEEADRFDRMLEPFGAMVIDRAELLPGDRVLDVGCGAGALSRQAAAQVGVEGTVTGIDLDPGLIGLAQRRADGLAHVVHRVADAGEVTGGPFDAVISRFALMLLADPGVALARFATRMRPGGRCVFCVWAEPTANEWFTLPLEVAGAPVPASAPPFALADAARNEALMRSAGFCDVIVERVERPMWLGRDVNDVLSAFSIEELAGRSANPRAAMELARRRLDASCTDHGVLVAGSAWLVSGRRGR